MKDPDIIVVIESEGGVVQDVTTMNNQETPVTVRIITIDFDDLNPTYNEFMVMEDIKNQIAEHLFELQAMRPGMIRKRIRHDIVHEYRKQLAQER